MIFFLHGPDSFRSRRKLRQIKDKFIKEVDPSGINVEVLDGERLEVADFERTVFSTPFLAKKRLVIIENLLTKNKGQKIHKEILEILNKKPPSHTVLVFWESAEFVPAKTSRSKTASKRTATLATRLKKERFAQEFKLLNELQVRHFIQNELTARQGQAEDAAVALLADLVGSNLWQADRELEKLLAYAKGRSITSSDVHLLSTSEKQEDIFALTNALGQRQKTRAIALVNEQLKRGGSPLELLTMISWQFKNLLAIKSFVETHGPGYPPARISAQLGLHPFVVKKTLVQAAGYDSSALKKTYQRLLELDHQLKTSQTDPLVLFDLLVSAV